MSLSQGEKLVRLQRALEAAGPASHRIEDVIDLIKAQQAQLWELRDGCIVSQVHSHPLYRSVNVWLVSGDLHDCLALEPTVMDWARAQGCTVATAAGRKGWGRAARHLGWVDGPPQFVKSLANGVGQHGQ